MIIKSTSSDPSDKDIVIVRVGAAGDLPNEKVKCCYVCRDRSFPHEPITFQKVNGRLRADGTYEVQRWNLVDYFTGRAHNHKPRRVGY